MSKKKILITSALIFLVCFSLLMIFSSSSYSEINQIEGQSVVTSTLPSLSSSPARTNVVSENVRRSCNNGICTDTIYTFPAYTLEEDGWHTLNEVSNFDWFGDRWKLSYRNYSVEIKPFVIYNNQYKDFNDIRNAFPNANLKDRVDLSEFNRKFSLNLTVPQNLVENTQYLGFELVNVTGLTWDDVTRDGATLTIKNKIDLDFQDILNSGYTLNIVNKTYLLIGNLSENYKNGNLYIDPTVQLGYSDIVDYSYGSAGSRATLTQGFHIGVDISSVPYPLTVIESVLFIV